MCESFYIIDLCVYIMVGIVAMGKIEIEGWSPVGEFLSDYTIVDSKRVRL